MFNEIRRDALSLEYFTEFFKVGGDLRIGVPSNSNPLLIPVIVIHVRSCIFKRVFWTTFSSFSLSPSLGLDEFLGTISASLLPSSLSGFMLCFLGFGYSHEKRVFLLKNIGCRYYVDGLHGFFIVSNQVDARPAVRRFVHVSHVNQIMAKPRCHAFIG